MLNFNTLLEDMSKEVDQFDRVIGYKKLPGYEKLKVVFEFECYLDVGEYDTGSSDGELMGEQLDITVIAPDEWINTLDYYFRPYSTMKVLQDDYSKWVEEKIVEYMEILREDLDEEDPEIEISESHLREKALDALTSNDAITHEAFFQDNNLNYLIDVINEYGFDPRYEWVPGYEGEWIFIEEPYQEDTEREFDEIIEELYPNIENQLRRYFDEPITVSTSYHGKRKLPTHWTIEPDGSLDEHIDDNVSVEIVSPWISGKDAEEYLNRFKEFFDYLSGITNSTTGCHMNVRYDKESYQEIDWLKLLILTKDKRELVLFSRHLNNTYAKPVLDRIGNYFNETDLSDKVINEFKELIKKEYYPTKYDSINLEKFMKDMDTKGESTNIQGFVEFRIPGDDYLGNYFEQSKKSLRKYMNLMLIGSDPTLFNKEYHVRLARFLRNLLDTKNNVKPLNKEITHPVAISDWYKELIIHFDKKLSVLQVVNELRNFMYGDENSYVEPLHIPLTDVASMDLSRVFNTGNTENFWLQLLMYKFLNHVSKKKFGRSERIASDNIKPKILNLIQSSLQKHLITKKDMIENIGYMRNKFRNVDLAPLQNLLRANTEDLIIGDEIEGGAYIGKFNGHHLVIARYEPVRKSWQQLPTLAEITSMDDGLANQEKIIDSHLLNLFPAMRYASHYEDGHWYLPAIKELEFARKQNSMLGLDYQFNHGLYWSSTEIDKTQAYMCPTVGKRKSIPKTTEQYVRPFKRIIV